LGRQGLAALFADVLRVPTADALAELFARVANADSSDAADDDRTGLLLTIDY